MTGQLRVDQRKDDVFDPFNQVVQCRRQHYRVGQRRGRYGHLVGGAGGQTEIAGIPVGATRQGSSDFQVDAQGNGSSATFVARYRESGRGLAFY